MLFAVVIPVLLPPRLARPAPNFSIAAVAVMAPLRASTSPEPGVTIRFVRGFAFGNDSAALTVLLPPLPTISPELTVSVFAPLSVIPLPRISSALTDVSADTDAFAVNLTFAPAAIVEENVAA
jgi:hypothetical protein